MTKSIVLWSVFSLASLATLIAYRTAWALPYYIELLSSLGVLALASGVMAVAHSKAGIWPWVAVACGLAIGQWWFLKMAIVMIGWKVRGFAP